jgi:hypothetical protein
MRWILTLICAAYVVALAASPASATVHAAMYCWVPDFEIAIACDDDDEGGSDGDDSVRAPVPQRHDQLGVVRQGVVIRQP